MAFIGYHASHEQFAPGELLELVQKAEGAGFSGVMSSDHFAPWSKRQGQSGFAWAWLGAAMQATHIPFGLITVPGGWRYHPAISAQAAATLAQMYPGRFPWLAVGSGEALNEHVIGSGWPNKTTRNNRLVSASEILKKLWLGETVSSTNPIPIDQAKLYTQPDSPPLIIAAALSEETAAWAGDWADGLITVNQDMSTLRAIISAFRGAGNQGPIFLQLHVSYASNDELARAHAFDQWRSNSISSEEAEEIKLTEEFDRLSETVTPGDLDKNVRISSEPELHISWLREYLSLGFEQIYVHNVGRNQTEFIEAYGKHVLPLLKDS
ncbi:coenzyme F420-dependent glucose-6-phosphate dehydrogenase [Phyllobacterium ifriqiyense]|uniref:Coenzyme F420-dependent glucose-6-phosphate dehydrogenase n=1 Tax=Phyllobacterium ifriqiyense TaxID=314238 RepID=A0ABU0S3R5_9HYPH|nr:TIGR03885 family FMN-dependent LLM class oxidoreductase [Phyllobacterium ifriqiyense]MDQ0995364.1 coenzyme F420-dependent glucose-6-phosphate dehydrogenase [Phyllobacterium ifriqiyense]